MQDAGPKLDDSHVPNNLLVISSTKAKMNALRDALGLGADLESTVLETAPHSIEPKATIRQITAIKKLFRTLGRDFDPQLANRLNRVAASKLITSLTKQLKKIC